MGVAVAVSRLVDNMGLLLDHGKNHNTYQFWYNSKGVANPRIGIRVKLDGLDLFEPVIRP